MSSRDDDGVAARATDGARPYEDVGAGVTAILQAAEEAADKIRAEGRRHADDLIHEAEEAVAARIQALTRDAEQVRADAEAEARDMRLAVEAYGTKRRRDADEEAARVLEEAETRAREINDAAEQRARAASRELVERTEALRAELQSLEGKRRKAADAVRRIVAHLEDALDGDPAEPEQHPERSAAPPPPPRRLDEDLRTDAVTRRPRRRLTR